MKYLKVFTDFVADMKELGYAERGRLFTAMLEYAETGEEPALPGNERFVWGTAKKNIDNQRTSYDHRCEVNKANGSEPKRKQANASDSLQEKDKEQEKEKEIPTKVGKKKKYARTFRPPTVEEVRAYCEQRHNNVDPEYFVAYYGSQNWIKANGEPVHDWKLTVITWEKDKAPKKQNAALKYEQKPIKKDDFDALVVDLGEQV